jgi:hypothetical protein
VGPGRTVGGAPSQIWGEPKKWAITAKVSHFKRTMFCSLLVVRSYHPLVEKKSLLWTPRGVPMYGTRSSYGTIYM